MLHGNGWGMCGQVDGGTASCLELLLHGLLLAVLMGCAFHQLCLPPAVPAHIHVPELLLGLGSVERGTWHPHTLILLMMDSTQHVPLLFKEGMGTAQNCSYLFFYSCREKRVTEGKG